MKIFDVYPLYDIEITKAKGEKLWDKNGVEYLDLYGGHAVISIGHGNEHYVSRIKDQLDKIAFYSNSVKIPQQQELADLLGELSGHDDYQLFLCNSGAEANENALKLASFHTGKKKVVAFSKGFHGRTSLAVAATDNKSIVAPVNETDNISFLPFNDEEALESYFTAHGVETCAVIIEGIQGVGGIVEATKPFLQLIRRLCDQYGALYIADSVQCGYGRTGKFFAHDYAEVNADIYTMAKGMGNGFPVGGILIAPHIKPKYGMLGTTFGGNHLACAAAIAVLEVMKKDHLIQNAFHLGEYLKSELSKLPNVVEVRGRGLMIGVEFNHPIEKLRNALVHEQHIFVGNASNKNVLRILPALNVPKESLEKLIQALNLLCKESMSV
ncbi:MAG: aminotransferase class III-fold pyridoxal phosphate-dependent enzyme [Cytophagales bacterium]